MALFTLGKDCIGARNTANYSSPTWSTINAIKDVKYEAEGITWAGDRRAMGHEQVAVTRLRHTVTVTLLWATADGVGCEAIRDAFFNKTSIDMLFASGVIATAGTEYIRSEWAVTKFSRPEELDGGMMVDVELKPYISTNSPAYTEVS